MTFQVLIATLVVFYLEIDQDLGLEMAQKLAFLPGV